MSSKIEEYKKNELKIIRLKNEKKNIHKKVKTKKKEGFVKKEHKKGIFKKKNVKEENIKHNLEATNIKKDIQNFEDKYKINKIKKNSFFKKLFGDFDLAFFFLDKKDKVKFYSKSYIIAPFFKYMLLPFLFILVFFVLTVVSVVSSSLFVLGGIASLLFLSFSIIDSKMDDFEIFEIIVLFMMIFLIIFTLFCFLFGSDFINFLFFQEHIFNFSFVSLILKVINGYFLSFFCCRFSKDFFDIKKTLKEKIDLKKYKYKKRIQLFKEVKENIKEDKKNKNEFIKKHEINYNKEINWLNKNKDILTTEICNDYDSFHTIYFQKEYAWNKDLKALVKNIIEKEKRSGINEQEAIHLLETELEYNLIND